MTIVRCTAKALGLLGVQPRALPDFEARDDDWYVNLVWIERRKCLLMVHAGTLFPIFVADVRKSDLTPFATFFVRLVTRELDDEQLPRTALGDLDTADVRLAKTASRSILGVMNDSARHAHYRIGAMGGLARSDIRIVNRALRRTLHSRAGVYVTPLDVVAKTGEWS